MTEWFVYMVRCVDGSLYTGVTTELQRRVDEHNGSNQLGARYTRSRRPVVLVYQERCDSRPHACQREYAIKQLTRGAKLALLSDRK
ncbi:MAG: GIY-YIG nuclease family protein [Gammaproteobacteria bacterium]|nr:GIY-YIG nuclease family protein [Gammaproteobacteria bacterium]MCF6230910.1 GIY-YIG nuclease family protein [Gammaproteobacteria bacterium]